MREYSYKNSHSGYHPARTGDEHNGDSSGLVKTFYGLVEVEQSWYYRDGAAARTTTFLQFVWSGRVYVRCFDRLMTKRTAVLAARKFANEIVTTQSIADGCARG